MTALLGMIGVIEAEANDLARVLDRRQEAQPGKLAAGRRSRRPYHLRGGSEGRRTGADQSDEIAWQVRRRLAKVDDTVAVDEAQPSGGLMLECRQSHIASSKVMGASYRRDAAAARMNSSIARRPILSDTDRPIVLPLR